MPLKHSTYRLRQGDGKNIWTVWCLSTIGRLSCNSLKLDIAENLTSHLSPSNWANSCGWQKYIIRRQDDLSRVVQFMQVTLQFVTHVYRPVWNSLSQWISCSVETRGNINLSRVPCRHQTTYTQLAQYAVSTRNDTQHQTTSCWC